MPTTKIDNCTVYEDSASVRFENSGAICDMDFDVNSYSKALSVSTTNIINMQDESCYMELTETQARKLKEFLNSHYPD